MPAIRLVPFGEQHLPGFRVLLNDPSSETALSTAERTLPRSRGGHGAARVVRQAGPARGHRVLVPARHRHLSSPRAPAAGQTPGQIRKPWRVSGGCLAPPMRPTVFDSLPDRIHRVDVTVMSQTTADDLPHIQKVWPAFEQIVGLRGRKMYALIDTATSSYTVCTPVRDGDDPDHLGLQVETMPAARTYAGGLSVSPLRSTSTSPSAWQSWRRRREWIPLVRLSSSTAVTTRSSSGCRSGRESTPRGWRTCGLATARTTSLSVTLDCLLANVEEHRRVLAVLTYLGERVNGWIATFTASVLGDDAARNSRGFAFVDPDDRVKYSVRTAGNARGRTHRRT